MPKRLSLLATILFVSFVGAAAQHVTKIKGSDLVINGESFFAASNIKSELERLARADGYIGPNETFRQVAVSGAPIASILNQYKSCNPKPVYLISDGGGIDLMQGDCTDSTCATIRNCRNTLMQYLTEMKNSGTKKLLWMVYPDPQGAQWARLKKNQDIWAQVVPPIINACTNPKTLLVDLRPVWAGKYSQYTSDGIHCTNAGGTATAEAFWKAMKENHFFDTGSTVETRQSPDQAATASSIVRGQRVMNGTLTLSLALGASGTEVMVRVTTVAGRTVFTAEKRAQGSGLQTLQFPLGSMVPGVYCMTVSADRASYQTSLLVQ